MSKTERKARRKLQYLLVTGALMSAIGATASAQLVLPMQGYESTGQVPTKYTPEEAQAVGLVEKWIDTMNKHDQAGNMALIDNNIAFRGDPLEPLLRGVEGYCSAFGFVASKTNSFALEELYAVGGPRDTLVLLKREDINGAATDVASLGGYKVPVAVLLRVTNGKISEWYDAPMNNVSIGALPRLANGAPGVPVGQQPIPERCKQYANGVFRAPRGPPHQRGPRCRPIPPRSPNSSSTWKKSRQRKLFAPGLPHVSRVIRCCSVRLSTSK